MVKWVGQKGQKNNPTFENRKWEGSHIHQLPDTNNKPSKKESFSAFTHSKC